MGKKPEVYVGDCKLLQESLDEESVPVYSSLQQPLHVHWNKQNLDEHTAMTTYLLSRDHITDRYCSSNGG